MAEAVACDNRLRKLMTESGGRDCCVMVWAIIWATMLARVWESMMGYISEGGAGWSEGEMVLRL